MLARLSSAGSRGKASSSAGGGAGPEQRQSSGSGVWSVVRGRRAGTGVGGGVVGSFLSISSTFRRQSNKGGGPDPWTRRNRLMHAHKVRTRAGAVVEVFFGSESMSVDGVPFRYEDMVLWSHSPTCFKFTTLAGGGGAQQVEIVLLPCEDGPSPAELNDMIGMRVAQLVATQTGCTQEEARSLATKHATDSDVRMAGEAASSLISPTPLQAAGAAAGGGGVRASGGA